MSPRWILDAITDLYKRPVDAIHRGGLGLGLGIGLGLGLVSLGGLPLVPTITLVVNHLVPRASISWPREKCEWQCWFCVRDCVVICVSERYTF